MVSDATIRILGGVTFGMVAILMFQYYYLRSYLGYKLFFAEAHKKLGETILKISKQAWVAYGALIAFLVNLVFIGSIAFNDNNWKNTDLNFLVATLALQITYYLVQLGYVYFLTFESTSMILPIQIALGICALCQLSSAIIAAIYAIGYCQWLNAIVAVWTTGFDFFIHSFLPSFKVESVKNYRMKLFDLSSSIDREMLL